MFTYSPSKECEWPFRKHGEASEESSSDVSVLKTAPGGTRWGWPTEVQVLGVKLHSPVLIL